VLKYREKILKMGKGRGYALESEAVAEGGGVSSRL
jgi:hypothetical protein